MDGSAALQPVDPTQTGEDEVSRAVRESLKRKRDEEAPPPPTVVAAPLTLPTKSCVHEVALPVGFTGDREALLAPRLVGKRAKEYPFTLDPFQETAIACLVRALAAFQPTGGAAVVPGADPSDARLPCQERRESVLVAAHTSAGKTVVAECVRRTHVASNLFAAVLQLAFAVTPRVACAVVAAR